MRRFSYVFILQCDRRLKSCVDVAQGPFPVRCSRWVSLNCGSGMWLMPLKEWSAIAPVGTFGQFAEPLPLRWLRARRSLICQDQ